LEKRQELITSLKPCLIFIFFVWTFPMQITIQDDTIFHLLSSFFEQASRADLPSSFNMGDHRIKKGVCVIIQQRPLLMLGVIKC